MTTLSTRNLLVLIPIITMALIIATAPTTTVVRPPSVVTTVEPSRWTPVTTTPSWPSPRPSISPRSTLKPSPSPSMRPPSKPTGSVYTRSWYGIASWYDDGPGLYAAAGPALRVGDWRGRRVRVCAGDDCVVVRLTDYCQCYGTRLIDLSRDAFSSIGSLSRGLMKVHVSTLG